LRGRAETIRLALEQAGASYKFIAINPADWPTLKPTLPFGQVPFYKDDEVAISQSNAILRHVGRKFNLYGSNNAQRAHVDVLLEAVVDYFTAFFPAIPKIKEGDLTSFTEATDKWLNQVTQLKQKNSPYFVGDNVTVADFSVFNTVDNFIRPLLGEDYLKKHPVFHQHRQTIANLPNIKAYLVSDRRLPTTLPGPILCTPEQCK